jgi:hypothetical protein
MIDQQKLTFMIKLYMIMHSAIQASGFKILKGKIWMW